MCVPDERSGVARDPALPRILADTESVDLQPDPRPVANGLLQKNAEDVKGGAGQ